ncbi:hypothetical protein [Bifidobacterium thermacidophilum]
MAGRIVADSIITNPQTADESAGFVAVAAEEWHNGTYLGGMGEQNAAA